MRILTINSYAGSLIQGAKDLGQLPYMSLEDSGYGVHLQRANFPGLDVRDTTASWPDQSLRGVAVIAHPPCAPFSGNAAHSSGPRGMNSPKFIPTIQCLHYALSQDCEALAVESVPNTCKGAWVLHDEMGKRFGYNVFRVLQNSWDFNVPQFRERFWCIFSREASLPLRFTPVHKPAKDILGAPGWVNPREERGLAIQRALLEAKGWPADHIMRGDFGYGSMRVVLGKFVQRCGIAPLTTEQRGELCAFGKFASSSMYLLDPEGYGLTLSGNTWYTYGGRNMTSGENKRIMGFPGDYFIPGNANHKNWLSRGVCPPVATWVLGNLINPPSTPDAIAQPGRVLRLGAAST